MVVSWVVSVALEVVAEYTLQFVGLKGRKGAPITIMVPTSTNGTARSGLPGKLHKVKWDITFSPIERKVAGCFPMVIDVVEKPRISIEFP